MFPAQMSNELPPDLQRLGDALTNAAARTAAADRQRREARRRLAVTVAVGALAFTTLMPGALGPAHHDVRFAGLTGAQNVVPPACDHARGALVMLPMCTAAEAAVPHRPYAWR
jgi:hypothetical protein